MRQFNPLKPFKPFKPLKPLIRHRVMRLAGIFMSVILITIICLIAIIHPNQMKTLLQERIQEKYQRSVIIQGDIRWALTPKVGWEIKEVIIKNLDTHQEHAENMVTLKRLRLIPQFWTLFIGKLVVDLDIEGLNLTLHRNQYNQNNWHDFVDIASTYFNDRSSRFFIINELKIKDSLVHWKDDIDKTEFYLNHFLFSSGKLNRAMNGNFVPTKTTFSFLDASKKALGSLDLEGKWLLNFTKHEVHAKSIMLSLKQENVKDPILKLNSEFKIQNINTEPFLEGSLSGEKLELNPILSLCKLSLPPMLSQIKNFTSSFKFQDPLLEIFSLNVDFAQGGSIAGHCRIDPDPNFQVLKLAGTFYGKQLKFDKNKISQIDDLSVNLNINDGIIKASPISFKFAHGKHFGNIEVNFRNHTPYYHISLQGDHFEANHPLTLLGFEKVFEGRAHSKINLTLNGDNITTLQKTLSGDIEVSIHDGKLHGIDLLSLLDHTQSTVKTLSDAMNNKKEPDVEKAIKHELEEWSRQANQSHRLSTPFETVKSTLHFKNGILSNSDFTLSHAKYRANGQTTIDLMNKSIQSKISTWLKYVPTETPNELNIYMKEVPLTLILNGPLNNFDLRPNLEQYTYDALKVNVKEKGDEESQGFGKLFGIQ